MARDGFYQPNGEDQSSVGGVVECIFGARHRAGARPLEDRMIQENLCVVVGREVEHEGEVASEWNEIVITGVLYDGCDLVRNDGRICRIVSRRQ